MSRHDEHLQLDLLGGVSGAGADAPKSGEKLAVRWVDTDGPGRLGCAAWPGSGESPKDDVMHLREHHRVSVVLAVTDDASELVSVAAEVGVDVRHLTPGSDRLAMQADALAADVRAGRRAVSVGEDASGAALPVCCALVVLGKSEEEALAAAKVSLAEADREALRAFIEARRSEPREEPIELVEPEVEKVVEPVEVEAHPTLELEAIARSPRTSRRVGAVLGGAIGDAMGHPTEFIRSFDAIRERFGPDGVTGYELYWERDGRRIAPYTDDTQMAECVLRSLLASRERQADLDATMRDMAERFVDWSKNPQGGHRAPGNACLAGCRNLERGAHWSEAGGPTAGGCGSVMRAYPFGLVFAHDLERAEAWAVAHSKLTHRDPIALAASAAMAVGIARVLRDEPLTLVLSEMVAAACRYSPKTAAMMARAIDEAQEGVGPETTLERLEGWAAHEAIAAAVYVFARHPDDPRAAILEGANTPGDSDSIATLAGALTGARTGVGAIPSAWIADLERADALVELALTI